MNTDQIIASLIAPIFLFLFLFYMHFKFRIKSYKRIMGAVFLGIIGFMVFAALNYIATRLDLASARSLRRTIFYSFIIIGFGSELIKFIILRLFFYPNRDFTGPVDGIVYSLFISSGFTITASILYNLDLVISLPNLIFIYTYSIASIIFAVILGFFTGLEKMRKNRIIDSLTGVSAATFFHGIYMFCFFTEDYMLLGLFGVVSTIIAVIFGIRALSITNDPMNKAGNNIISS